MLPVSMEDTELFPKKRMIEVRPPPAHFDAEAFKQMRQSLSRLWWSRLVIAVRGYVINYVQNDDHRLFACDDAFIAIHRNLGEERCENDEQFTSDVATIAEYPEMGTVFVDLIRGKGTANPWLEDDVKDSFVRVFGQPNPTTFAVADGQKLAFAEFVRVLSTLQERWKTERAEKKKGIRFETDPEWQPDDRVVLFQQFFEGNRTWVLLDFDRYILAQWRPRGARIIFGDRFVEKKLRAGLKLCDVCGMLEQHPGQFVECEKSSVCSPECLQQLPAVGGTTIRVV